MQLTKEKRGECSILMIQGRLDGSTSPKFETEVLAWLSEGGKSFVLDMAGISFMSSAALRVLLSMAKRVARMGGKVVLSSPNAVVSEVFEISNFSAMFTICQTVEEGVAAATAGAAQSAPVAPVDPAPKAVTPATPVPEPIPPVVSSKPAPVSPPPVGAKSEASVGPVAEVPPLTKETVPPAAPNPPAPAASPSIPKSEEKPVPVDVSVKPVAAAITPPPVAPAPPITSAPAGAPESKTARPPAVTPTTAAKNKGAAKIELIVGTHIIECRDGDVIGLEGTVAPHLFKSAPSLQPRHLLIGKGTDSWFVMIPRNVEVKTHFDDAVMTPGERLTLSGEHQLKIADFAFSLRLSEGSPVSINDSFFTRLMKILRLG